MKSSTYFLGNKSIIKNVAIVLFIFMAAAVQGSIPFISITTLGQAVAVIGYPISFINQGGLTLVADNMGYPSSAPMSTLLAPSLLMQIFLKVGFAPVDAFNFSFLSFLAFGFVGAVKICRYLSVGFCQSLSAAFLWFIFPIVWASSDYSHLHFGFVAFPGFVFSLFILLDAVKNKSRSVYPALFYFSCVFVSVFTDGYTFVFFAVIASVFVLYYSFRFFGLLARRSLYLYFLHFISFLAAYVCYSLYIGKSEYSLAPLDFFRGWGVDFVYLLIPSDGMHWLWDFLGISETRTSEKHFGDASVWRSTYIAPLLIFSIYGYIKIRRKFELSGALVIVAFFSLYMALGPSVKFNSVKSHSMDRGMPDQYALFPTGNSFLSENVPGFRSMRASYRWILLTYFSCWLILVFYLSRRRHPETMGGWLVIFVLVLTFLPNLQSHLDKKIRLYNGFVGIDNELLAPLGDSVSKGEIVAFLPPGNDFLINYLAPSLDVRAYNVGGDKNVVSARAHWPDTLKRFPMNTINEDFSERILLILTHDDADAIILPFIDLLLSAHDWPPSSVDGARFSEVIRNLKNTGFVSVQEERYYAVVRLNSALDTPNSRAKIQRSIIENTCLSPYCIEVSGFAPSALTIVGVVDNGEISSTGDRGFVHFGPYSAINAGRYTLEVYGHIEEADGSWVDVVSSRGEIVHAKFDIGEGQKGNGAILNETVNIDSKVQDLEIRVFAGEGDLLTLESYRLSPLEM